jgi:hypothetical protein
MSRSLPYEVQTSKIAGRGVFSTRPIKKGARIIEYQGERITHEEADNRYDDEAMESHHTMLFSLDDVWCIDAIRTGNDARYINHSCAPNCEAVQEGDRVFIFSTTVIPKGEELTYDYRYDYDESISLAKAKRLYPCYCGTASCRGTIVLPRPAPKSKKAAPKKAAPKKAAPKKAAPKKAAPRKAAPKKAARKR